MSLLRLHVAAFAVAMALATGCGASTKPTLNVLSVHQSPARRDMVVYVEVVNPAARPIKLQKLQYTFASAGTPAGASPAATGEVELGARLVAAGAAVVVEVPLPIDALEIAGDNLILAGRLFAEQDRIIRRFDVEAEVATPIERDWDHLAP
ncbi:MAG TPA: hypothetical protein VM734_34360 [Kofleriaceae bacterium]|nr:hypothetical protein [Kofleriaceae bacterium]